MGLYFFDKKKIIIIGSLLACGYMVIFPEITMRASKAAIDIWLNSIVPVIMPFFIAAGFLKGIGVCSNLPVRLYPFIMAMLSGYPMGAKITGDYYREGRIQDDRIYGLLSYSMITGPAFILGTVGVSLLNSYRMGVILAVSHYCGALLNGFLFGGYMSVKTDRVQNNTDSSSGVSYYSVLTEAMLDSFKSVAIILAYIMLFMIVCSTISESGIFDGESGRLPEALINGIMEMTVGCGKMAASGESSLIKLLSVSFMISFGGFSVLGQSLSMLKNCPVTASKLMKIKISHGLISVIISFVICRFVII